LEERMAKEKKSVKSSAWMQSEETQWVIAELQVLMDNLQTDLLHQSLEGNADSIGRYTLQRLSRMEGIAMAIELFYPEEEEEDESNG
jgi:hypothetical protein|tara:strand:- start:310 stop:570 length:261 start_codon:yes stop_codon:yes gene_type:complete